MKLLKLSLINTLENNVGYDISYSSISPSLFSNIRIKGLKFTRKGNPDDVLIEIKSLKAYYSPFYLFKKQNFETPLHAIKRFVVSGIEMNLDANKDNRLIGELSGSPGNRSNVRLLPLTTKISGRNIDLTIKSDSGSISARNVSVNLVPSEEDYITSFSGSIFISPGRDLQLPVERITADISAKGSLSEFFKTINVTVKTRNLSSDIADIGNQTFQLISSSNGFEIRKVQDDRPIDLSFRYDRALGNAVVSFNSEDFHPDRLITLKGDFKQYNRYLSSVISGTGSLLWGSDLSRMVYSLKSKIWLNQKIFNRSFVINSDLTGDADQINVRSLSCRIPEGQFFFTGNINTGTFFPTGSIRIVDLNLPGYKLNSRMNIEHREGFLHLTTDSFGINKEHLHNVDLIIYPDINQSTASLKAELGEGIVTVDAILDSPRKPDLTLYAKTSDLPIDRLTDFLPGTASKWNIPSAFLHSDLSSEIYLNSDMKSITGQINKFAIVSTLDKNNSLSFSGNFGKDEININSLAINWDDYVLNGYINAGRDASGFRMTTNFDLQDQPYKLDMLYKNDNLFLQGDYGISGLIRKVDKNNYTFKLNSSSLPLPWGKSLYYADLDVSGNMDNNGWNVFLDHSLIRTDTVSFLDKPELELTARIDKNGADIFSVKYKDDKSALKGLGRITYGSSTGESSWVSLSDETGKSNEKYNLFFAMNHGVIDSRVSITDASLDRFQNTGLGGTVSLDASLSGTEDNPEYRAIIKTDNMTLNSVPVSMSTSLQGDRDKIRISDLELEYNGTILDRGLILLELYKGKMLATAGLSRTINNSKVTTALSARIQTNDPLNIFSLQKLKNSDFSGTLSLAPITWDKQKTFPRVDVNLNRKGDLLSGEAGNGKIFQGSYNFQDGRINLNVKDLFPVRFQADGHINNGQIEAQVNNLVFYPSFINYFMPTDPFRKKRHVIFKNGTITGDFSVSGPLADPDYNGTLKANSITVESPYIAEIPEPVNTTGHLEGHKLDLDSFVIPLKKGQIQVKSDFGFDGGLPAIYNVDLQITGSSGVRIAYAIPDFSWDGHFTGEAHIEGDNNGGFLKGNLLCNDLISSLESDAVLPKNLNTVHSPSVNGFTVDLTIKTGRDVNFYLPTRKVPIIQATADNGDDVNIAYDSRSDILALTGRVAIRTGEINYFGKKFFLQEGFIDFNENQIKFNPRLNVKADVVTKDETGQDVTISLLFDDYLMNEFKPEFISFPRKSQNEIMALLGQSFIPSTDPDQVSVASLLVATGGMIGKNTIMKPFEEAIKSSLHLDFVSLNTNIIENAILDRFQNRNLYNVEPQQMNFARYLKGTSLFVGEYLGDKLFLEGSLVVDYDDSHSVSSAMSGLELNVNFDLQFITPFILIDWIYNPKNDPDSDFFVPQNTISLTWQYSY